MEKNLNEPEFHLGKTHVSCPYSKEMPKIRKFHREKKTGNYQLLLKSFYGTFSDEVVGPKSDEQSDEIRCIEQD